MTDKYTLQDIQDFWTQQVERHGRSSNASWSDLPVIQMEIRELLKRIEDGDSVLDIGCANGFTSFALARKRHIRIRGLDYIPGMIQQARGALGECDAELRERMAFDVGDITSLDEPDNHYDKVVVVRVIINLRDLDNQLTGLRNSARVVKPGGLLLLSEATLQGWNNLNAFRREWGLSDIPMPPFNTYLDQDRVVECLAPQMDLVEIVNFASTYFVGTRVLKPLLAKVADIDINIASPEMEMNRFFSMLPAAGDYGTQKLMVFRKKQCPR